MNQGKSYLYLRPLAGPGCYNPMAGWEDNDLDDILDQALTAAPPRRPSLSDEDAKKNKSLSVTNHGWSDDDIPADPKFELVQESFNYSINVDEDEIEDQCGYANQLIDKPDVAVPQGFGQNAAVFQRVSKGWSDDELNINDINLDPVQPINPAPDLETASSEKHIDTNQDILEEPVKSVSCFLSPTILSEARGQDGWCDDDLEIDIPEPPIYDLKQATFPQCSSTSKTSDLVLTEVPTQPQISHLTKTSQAGWQNDDLEIDVFLAGSLARSPSLTNNAHTNAIKVIDGSSKDSGVEKAVLDGCIESDNKMEPLNFDFKNELFGITDIPATYDNGDEHSNKIEQQWDQHSAEDYDENLTFNAITNSPVPEHEESSAKLDGGLVHHNKITVERCIMDDDPHAFNSPCPKADIFSGCKQIDDFDLDLPESVLPAQGTMSPIAPRPTISDNDESSETECIVDSIQNFDNSQFEGNIEPPQMSKSLTALKENSKPSSFDIVESGTDDFTSPSATSASKKDSQLEAYGLSADDRGFSGVIKNIEMTECDDSKLAIHSSVSIGWLDEELDIPDFPSTDRLITVQDDIVEVPVQETNEVENQGTFKKKSPIIGSVVMKPLAQSKILNYEPEGMTTGEVEICKHTLYDRFSKDNATGWDNDDIELSDEVYCWASNDIKLVNFPPSNPVAEDIFTDYLIGVHQNITEQNPVTRKLAATDDVTPADFAGVYGHIDNNPSLSDQFISEHLGQSESDAKREELTSPTQWLSGVLKTLGNWSYIYCCTHYFI